MSKQSKKAAKQAAKSLDQVRKALHPAPKILIDDPLFKHIEINGEEFISFNSVEGNVEYAYHACIRPALTTILGSDAVKEANNVFPIEVMVKRRLEIQGNLSDVHDMDFSEDPFKVLNDLLIKRSTDTREAVDARLARGVIEGNDLLILFPAGSEATINDGESTIGGIVEDIKLTRSWMGVFWNVGLRTMVDRAGVVEEVIRNIEFPHWAGTRPLAECPMQRVDRESELFAGLVARGETFRAVTGGVNYVRCSGLIEKFRYYRSTLFRADGRVMIDAASYALMDSDGYEEQMRMLEIRQTMAERHSGKKKVARGVEVRDEDLWRCSPYVFGFSLRAKQWGRMKVEEISPIAYREDAFERLVMDSDTKTMIRALVKNSGASFTDLVEGKGGGCIFLLEGEPGQGKTLCAETVAEDLKRPLYPISVGELGTDPDTLDERLRMILDIATRWNAVLLLDEADIFLEERDTHNITRNAIVSVFLRLLEYHEGVLFLTTNRCQNIDPAFLSRISLAISFASADERKRLTIWRQLLEAAGIGGVFSDGLGGYDVNGRQIKNAIRMAQTLALSEERDVTTDDINRTIRKNAEFNTRLQSKRREMVAKPRVAA